MDSKYPLDASSKIQKKQILALIPSLEITPRSHLAMPLELQGPWVESGQPDRTRRTVLGSRPPQHFSSPAVPPSTQQAANSRQTEDASKTRSESDDVERPISAARLSTAAVLLLIGLYAASHFVFVNTSRHIPQTQRRPPPAPPAAASHPPSAKTMPGDTGREDIKKLQAELMQLKKVFAQEKALRDRLESEKNKQWERQMQADKEALRRRDEEQQKERQKQVSDQEKRHQAIARQLDALLSSVRAENSDRVTAVSEVGCAKARREK